MFRIHSPASVVFLTLTVYACAKDNSVSRTEVDIKYHSVIVEKIDVNLSDTSLEGYSGVMADSLYFFDNIFSYLYKISIDGTVCSKCLGLGHGPGEFPSRSTEGVCVNENDGCLYTLNDICSYRYYPDGKLDKLEMDYFVGAQTDYSSPRAYTTWNEVVLRSYGKYLYFNILGNNESVDIMTCADYFKKAAVLMKVNLETGKMNPILGYSDYYVENENVRHLPFIYFDTDEDGDLLISFQADPYIYRYSGDKRLPVVFGVPGKNLEDNYMSSSLSVESFENAYLHDIAAAGYYYDLESVGDIVFRSYRKHASAEYDGLQIYDGNVLVGDVDVPAQFRVAGCIGGYYVTRISVDEATGKSWFYRFKLNDYE